MKIGIITYHNAINYGAVLQSYALSRYLRSIGIDAEIIDYRCPAVKQQYELKPPNKCSSLLNFFNHNLTNIAHIGKKKHFSTFLNGLPLSKPVDQNELASMSYDAYITGSDQVFNPTCNMSDSAYLLDFVKKGKKYSYAASMGSIEQFKSFKGDTYKLLYTFDGVSLREPDAAEYLSELLGRKCTTVCDPVWLLDKKQWEQGFNRSKDVAKPYIFVYNLMDFKFMRDYVKYLKIKTGLPVIVSSRTLLGDALYFSVGHLASNYGPSEFMDAIIHSSFFVTDSFHGTSLAIILRKRFAIALDPRKETTNSRFNNIVNDMGFEGQVINTQNNSDPYDNEILFEKADNYMDRMISSSKEFIDEIINLRTV